MPIHLRIALLLFVVVTAGSASGIVMRHDVPESNYLAEERDWPTVALFHLRNRKGAGTGTLVHAEWVLTAGHVAHFLKLGDTVSLGGDRYTIAERIVHPEYTLNQPAHDIGLVRLDRPVPGVTPATPYPGSDETGLGIVFVGAGWPGNGLTGASGDPGTLRVAQNTVDTVREGLLVFDFDPPESALPREGISGPGDSGGPAFLVRDGVHYVLGVSAFQGESPTGVEGVYGVNEYYTRVSAYHDWIQSLVD